MLLGWHDSWRDKRRIVYVQDATFARVFHVRENSSFLACKKHSKLNYMSHEQHDAGAITAVHKAMTPFDVYVHLGNKIDDANKKTETTVKNMTEAFFDRLSVVEGNQRKDRADLAAVREGRFPQKPLWAMVAAIVLCALSIAGVASCNDIRPPMVPAHYSSAFAGR